MILLLYRDQHHVVIAQIVIVFTSRALNAATALSKVLSYFLPEYLFRGLLTTVDCAVLYLDRCQA